MKFPNASIIQRSLRRFFALLALSLSLSLLINSARAQVAVFSTLRPDGTYFGGSGQFIDGSGTPQSGYQSIANEFSPAFTADLFSIDVGISLQQPGSNGQVTVHIYGNTPVANVPNTAMELASGQLTATSVIGTTNSELQTFTYSGSPVSLVAGQIYWLALTPVAANTNVIWNDNDLGPDGGEGRIASSDDGTLYTNPFLGELSAFQINAVPEPSTYALCLSGALLVFGARHFRKTR